MSNFKYNEQEDITNHPRTVIRTDIDPACSRPLKDFGFEDLKNPDLRVLTGGKYYTATDSTTASSPTTTDVSSSYILNNDLNTLYDGPIDWPVGVFPIRDGSCTSWTERESNSYQWATSSAGMKFKLTWDANYTLSLYQNDTLLYSFLNCPQFMVDIQAPGGKGGNGDGWKLAGTPRGYSGGGGGGGGFATILFNKDCGGVLLEQVPAGHIYGYVGASFEYPIGGVECGRNASGRTPGTGGIANVWGGTGVYIINKITGGNGGQGFSEATWSNNESFPGEINEPYGEHGFGCGGSFTLAGGCISLSPRRLNDSPYMFARGTGAYPANTVHYGSYNLYPGGGGGGSVLGDGGKGQASNSSSTATSGSNGGGGGGGGTKVNDCTATGADGGNGRIIFYIPTHT